MLKRDQRYISSNRVLHSLARWLHIHHPIRHITFATYMADNVFGSDSRLTFGWAASPGYWGLIVSAAEHSHYNTTIESALTLIRRKSNDAAFQIRPLGNRKTHVNHARSENENTPKGGIQ